MRFLEICVVGLNIAYLLLVIYGKRVGWLFGSIGSLLFVVANVYQQLYMDAMLNSYYVVVGIYGFCSWQQEKEHFEARSVVPACFWANVALVIFGSIISGKLLAHYTLNLLSYLDSAVTLLSFYATWLAAKKYIENWWVWLVANPLAVVLYASKGGYLYAGLFVVYTLLAAYGFFQWKKKLRNA